MLVPAFATRAGRTSPSSLLRPAPAFEETTASPGAASSGLRRPSRVGPRLLKVEMLAREEPLLRQLPIVIARRAVAGVVRLIAERGSYCLLVKRERCGAVNAAT